MNTTISVEKKTTLWVVIILGALTAFGPLCMDLYLPALPMVSHDLHTSTSVTQFSMTACFVGLAIGQMFFGPMSDLSGRKKPLIGALILFTVASFLCGLTSSIIIHLILRFMQGFTGAAGIVIAKAAARDLYSGKELTKFMSMLGLVNGVAPIAAPLLGGLLLAMGDWHLVFYTLSLGGTLLLIGVVWQLPETLHLQNRTRGNFFTPFKAFPIIVKDKEFMGYSLTQSFILTCMFGYIAASPFVLQKMYGLSPQWFSASFALNGLGIVLMTQLTGRLVGKYDERTILRFGVWQATIGSLLLLMVAIFKWPLILLLLGFFITVSSVGLVSPTGFSLGMQNQGQHAGSASAMLGLLPFLGGSIVSPLVGIAGELTAIPMAITMLSCTLLALIVNTINTQKSTKRRKEENA
ncbi:multidrug effflux MFS transporter [Rummeliibacillus pycnus]|uniref:multidrug effflux MFS transporter n=1 Tax=Rummeliibacillus pycnus TaxID=101070 RepID=UPI000C9A7003|nr:multidrug effflux MFS transporter [Rummeliibacillus pycnus]